LSVIRLVLRWNLLIKTEQKVLFKKFISWMNLTTLFFSSQSGAELDKNPKTQPFPQGFPYVFGFISPCRCVEKNRFVVLCFFVLWTRIRQFFFWKNPRWGRSYLSKLWKLLVPSIFQKMRFSQKILLRFVEAQNTKKSWRTFFDKTQNGSVNQDSDFQYKYYFWKISVNQRQNIFFILATVLFSRKTTFY
jgi:hypothetical protein